MTIHFTIPCIPTGKGRPRAFVRNGRVATYTPTKTEQAERSFLALAAPYRPATPLDGPLSLFVVAVFEVPQSYSRKRRERCLAGQELPAKKPDCSNIVKLIEDAMNGVFYRDDAQLVDVHIVKRYGDAASISVELRERDEALVGLSG